MFSVKRNKILKLLVNNGYKNIYLHINKQRKFFSVSRLVAKHFIPNIENKEQVDHIDRNKLNNHISNLRWATCSENLGNQLSRKGSTSKYKGVYFHKSRGKWMARIKVNGKRKYLGRFKYEKEAALAYNKAAKEIYGEFALLNNME